MQLSNHSQLMLVCFPSVLYDPPYVTLHFSQQIGSFKLFVCSLSSVFASSWSNFAYYSLGSQTYQGMAEVWCRSLATLPEMHWNYFLWEENLLRNKQWTELEMGSNVQKNNFPGYEKRLPDYPFLNPSLLNQDSDNIFS